eukprot:6491200-Amphidinium_carterae.1
MHLRVSLNFDWCHRVVNDWSLALGHSGLHIVRLEYKLATTARFGPWGGQANHWQLKNAADQFFHTHDHTSWLFQVVYDKLCAARPDLRQHPDYGDESHEMLVFEMCKSELASARMGGNPQLARWWTVEQRARSLQSCRWMLVLVLLYLGYHKGWWPDANSCPLFSRRSRYMQNPDHESGDMDAEQASGIAEPEGEQGAEEGLGEMPASALEAGSLSKARDTCTTRRAGSILKEVTHLLCDDIGCFLWQGLSHMVMPLERTFAEVVRNMKSREGVEVHLKGLASGDLFRGVISGLLAWFGDPSFASACLPPHLSDTWTSYQQKQIEVVGQHLFQCLLRLCTELQISSLMYAQPPVQFMRLLSSDADEARSCLNDMKLDWDALNVFEQTMHTGADSDEALQLHHALVPPHLQWVREAWLRCYELDWSSVPLELRHQLECYQRAHHSTLQVENTFNECRAQARKSKTYRQSPASLWNVSCYGHTAAEFGREVVRHESTETHASERKLPDGLFTQKCCEGTVQEEVLQKLCEKSPSWPTHSASSLKQSAVAWELVRTRRGKFEDMQYAWLSLLLEPGTLIIDTASRGTGARLITGVTKYGYFWIRPEVNMRDKRVAFCSQSQQLHFDILERPEDWKVAKLRMRPPSTSDGERCGLSTGFMCDVVQDEKTYRVHQFGAISGFKHMSCLYLKRLRKWCGLHQPCKPAEATLVSSLLEHLCPKTFGPELVKTALQSRKVKGFEVLLKSANVLNLEKETVAEGFLDEAETEYTDLEAIQQWEELKRQRDQLDMDAETLQKFLADWMSVRAVPKGHSESAESSGSGSAVGRKFMPLRTEGYSAEELKTWLPVGSSMTKDCRENRWRLRCEHLPGSGDKSRSFGRRSGVTDYDAMRLLLLQAWAATTAATGVERPFDIEEMPSPAVAR